VTYPDYWREFDGIAPNRPVTASLMTASDGVPLHTYELGDPSRECVLLVCPVATPFLLFARVAEQLAANYFVLSHESRGAPYMPGSLGPESLTLERFAADVEENLARRGIESAHVVAWCSGAQMAARLLQNGRVRFKSLALIAPGLAAKVVALEEKLPWQEVFLPLLESVAFADAETARTLFESVRHFVTVATPVAEPDLTIQRLVTMNLRTVESFQAFGRLYFAFLAHPDYETRDRMIEVAIDRTPTLALHCRDDTVISYKCTLQLSARPGQLKVIVGDAGGHFSPYKNPNFICSNLFEFYGSLAARSAES
jgi:pimeloyl-ACP methyl ester carboxylesterase